MPHNLPSTDEGQKPLRFVRIHEVLARTGLARPTVYKRIAAGDFPPPVKVGSASVWVESELDAWMRSRIRTRPANPQEARTT